MLKKTLCIAAIINGFISADEGMWPFNSVPKEAIETQYGTILDDAWITHVQKSCLRVSLGGSASFVSSKGLVMTNHHVASKAIYNLSSQENDLMANGFYADKYDQELKCPNMYVDVLMEIQDRTSEVLGRLDNLTDAEKECRKKSRIAKIKLDAQEATGLQPEIITLYQGAKYHLYLYKRYSDVRLVMAPEKSIAFFGGDQDNFEFPRYDLDVTFFRVYENGKPLDVEHYLKWSEAGPQSLEPLFVAGHPGRTERLFTADHLKFLKDIELPTVLKYIEEKKTLLEAYCQTGPENNRVASQDLFRFLNGRKVLTAIYQGLLDQPTIANKIAFEKELFGSLEFAPIKRLSEALILNQNECLRYFVLEGIASRYCRLFSIAKHFVRLADERLLPNEKRLKEYADTELKTLSLELLSKEPIYMDLEQLQLVDGLSRVIKVMGEDHPVSVLILKNGSLEDFANELMSNTTLASFDSRSALYENLALVKESTDPLIVLARELDPISRSFRKSREDHFESVTKESYKEIAKTIFDRYGESVYPDATFSLRLSIGTLLGYEEDGSYIEPVTQIGGAFKHAEKHGSSQDHQLPISWLENQNRIDSTVPLNFVSTNDIIGGNSGSPVINKNAEVVGLIFDGNKQSLTWDHQFDQVQGRAVSVHSAGIIEALNSVYQAGPLVDEILGR